MNPKHIARLAALSARDSIGSLTPDETAELERLHQQHRQAFPHHHQPKPTDPFHRQLAEELRVVANKVERGEFRFLAFACDGLARTVHHTPEETP